MKFMIALALSICAVAGCAATPNVSVTITAPSAPVAAKGAPLRRCDFASSRTLHERARDLGSASPSIALAAIADVLAESCGGPLAALAGKLEADPTLRAARDDRDVVCDTEAAAGAIDAVLRGTLAPLVAPACFSEESSAGCPLPWSVAGLWESDEEWAEARFFPEPARTRPAAVPLGPRFALASAILDEDRSFSAYVLAAHALGHAPPPKELVVVEGTRVCR